jgi:hypothetical protein
MPAVLSTGSSRGLGAVQYGRPHMQCGCCAVLKAIEEAKLRGKNDDTIQVHLHQTV